MPLCKDPVAVIELPITVLFVCPSHSHKIKKPCYLSIFNTVPWNRRQSLCVSTQFAVCSIHNNQHHLQKPHRQNMGSKFPQIRNGLVWFIGLRETQKMFYFRCSRNPAQLLLKSSCSTVRLSELTTWERLKVFLKHMILGSFTKICRHIPLLVKTGQQ